MELRELGYFAAVYEERSVTAAARRCFISQPSVSAALASLEHELGAALFVRHRRGATPTEAGERLYPVARRLVDEAMALKATFKSPRPAEPPLVVGVMRAVDAERVRELIAALAGELGGAQLRVVGDAEPCDLRLVSRGLLAKGEAFTPLWSERFVVALPSPHPLALRATLRATDLLGLPVVERCHCEYARHFPRGKRRVEVAAVAASEEWALALVGAGVGIAIVPSGVRHDAHVVLRELADVRVDREVGLAHASKQALSTVAQRALAAARRAFAASSRTPRRRSLA